MNLPSGLERNQPQPHVFIPFVCVFHSRFVPQKSKTIYQNAFLFNCMESDADAKDKTVY